MYACRKGILIGSCSFLGEVTANNMETVLASADGEIDETIFSSIFTDEFIASVESLLTKKEAIMKEIKKLQAEAQTSGRVSLTKWIASREFTFLSNGNIILENGFNWKNLGNSLDPQTFNSIFSLDAVASYGVPKKKAMLVEVEQSKTKANSFTSSARSLPFSLASILVLFFVSRSLQL